MNVILLEKWLENHGVEDKGQWVREKFVPRLERHLNEGGDWCPTDLPHLEQSESGVVINDWNNTGDVEPFYLYSDRGLNYVTHVVLTSYVYPNDSEQQVLVSLIEDMC